MKTNMRRSAATALVLGISPLALATPSTAAVGDHFVVDTQFYAGQSAVTHTTGVFTGCTKVRDMFGSGEEIGGVLHFMGVKRVLCASGAKVFLEYHVTFNESTETTTGTWEVVRSSLAGVDADEGGTLTGTATGCTPERYAGGCIIDTFTLTS